MKLLRLAVFLTIPLLCAQGQTRTPCTHTAVWLSPGQLLKLVVKQAPVIQPGMLDRNHLHGTVTVRVLIDEQGSVESVRLIADHPLAISAAVDSVRNSRFNPYMVHGKTMCSTGRLDVSYDFRTGVIQK